MLAKKPKLEEKLKYSRLHWVRYRGWEEKRKALQLGNREEKGDHLSGSIRREKNVLVFCVTMQPFTSLRRNF